MTKICFETESKKEFENDPKDFSIESQERVALDRTARVRIQTINLQDSKTQQAFADSTDINNIIAKYKKTGELPLARKNGVFADISHITDYHSSLNTVLKANEAFGLLPADLRTRFENDPNKLLAFLNDEKNYDEGVSLGLYNPKPVPQNDEIKNQNQNPNQKQKNKTTKEEQLNLNKNETE